MQPQYTLTKLLLLQYRIHTDDLGYKSCATLPSVLDAVLATLEVSQSPSPSAAALFFRLLTRSFKGMTQYWKPGYS